MTDPARTLGRDAANPRKPKTVWLAQGMCLLVGVSCLYFSTLLADTSLVIAGIGLLHLGLLFGVQLRQPWARWLVVVWFGAMGAAALFQGLRALATNTDEPLLLTTVTVNFLLCSIVTIHFVLNDEVRTFFDVVRPSRTGRDITRDNPYSAPLDP